MSKWIITLELESDYNPNKWNWHELLELHPDESLQVNISEGESK